MALKPIFIQYTAPYYKTHIDVRGHKVTVINK